MATDPLHSIRERSIRSMPSTSSLRRSSSDVREKNEKLMRERSIRTNRKHKFVECLCGGDVNIAELRKLAWAGIPNDFRPVAWQLLLVRVLTYPPFNLTFKGLSDFAHSIQNSYFRTKTY